MKENRTSRLIDALMDGPKTRQELKEISGFNSISIVSEMMSRIGSVRKGKLRKGRPWFYWLDQRPRERTYASEHISEIATLRDKGTSYKIIIRQLNIESTPEALSVMLCEYRKKARQ